MDVDLTQRRVAGVDEAVRRARGNDCDGASLHLALLIADRNGGAAFDRESGFAVTT